MSSSRRKSSAPSTPVRFQGLGGHLDFTRRARAGTLSNRVRDATLGVVAVVALPLGFQVKLGLLRGKSFPAGLHAAEASCVSSSSLRAFRAAIVRAVWSSKMPLASTPGILRREGVDPAFHITWARFRMMRRYLAHCPGSHLSWCRVMVQFICCLPLLLRLALPGMVMKGVGCSVLSLPIG